MAPSVRAAAPLALLSTIVCARAAAEGPRLLGEAEFLERFQRADPRFEAARARAAAARGDVLEARALPNPAVSYDREEVFAAGRSLADDFLRLSLPIEISGARGRRIDAAEASAAAAAREGEHERWLLVLEGLAVFRDAAYQRLRVDTLRAGREELAGVVGLVGARRRAGDVAGYDVARIELELGTADDALAVAESDLHTARAALARLVGEPGGLIDADSALEPPAAPPHAGPLVEAARAARSDRAAVALRLRAAGAEGAAAARGWVPLVELSGGLKSSDLGEETALGYVAGVNLTLPIFARGQGGRARAEARGREQGALARAIDAEIATGVAAARETLGRRIEQTRRWRTAQLPRALTLLRAAESAYREGERPIFELLDAARVARDVRLRELELRRDVARAELDLWRVLGRRP
jgi:cobalt-zinc-cadmium efflux system outer membrane protein